MKKQHVNFKVSVTSYTYSERLDTEIERLDLIYFDSLTSQISRPKSILELSSETYPLYCIETTVLRIGDKDKRLLTNQNEQFFTW